MTPKEKLIVASFTMALSLAGYILIIIAGGWKLGAGVFLVHVAINIDQWFARNAEREKR